MAPRIYLSKPDVTESEIAHVVRALRSGWVAPLGPEVDAFEQEICDFLGGDVAAVALSSGTAALHLGLVEMGVAPGDEVVVPTLTFGASAFSVVYTGARPVFMDVLGETGNLDPDLLERFLRERARLGRLPKAVMTVDLLGIPSGCARLAEVCGRYDVPLIEDAAEALGAVDHAGASGTFGRFAALSFNGNKIMTTSGGGMFVTSDPAMAARVRYRSTQARQPVPWYEHTEIGFNYRMSNVLAALGRGQLERLPAMIERRRAHLAGYRDGLVHLGRLLEDRSVESNAWLTGLVLEDPSLRDVVIKGLAKQGIEARHLWKPMHMQPVFAGAETVTTGTAEALFAQTVCLPSGSGMSDGEREEVIRAVVALVADEK